MMMAKIGQRRPESEEGKEVEGIGGGRVGETRGAGEVGGAGGGVDSDSLGAPSGKLAGA